MLELPHRSRKPVQRCHNDAGITLTELIVAMALASILGGLTLTIFLSSNTSTTQTVASSISSSSARVALDSWVSLLQTAALPGATPGRVTAGVPDNPKSGTGPNAIGLGQMIVSISPSSITFFSNVNNMSAGSTTIGYATEVTLEWRANGADLCPASSSTSPAPSLPAQGCLVEDRTTYAADGTPSDVTRKLVDNVSMGAVSAAGACGESDPTVASALIPQNRLFTACGSGQTLSGATTDTNVLTNSTGSTASPPVGIVVAFTVTNQDNNGTTHSQPYVATAAVPALRNGGA